MLPYNQSFRTLLRKYIPQVSEYQLRRHEEIIGLRNELILESAYAPEPNDLQNYIAVIEGLSSRAREVFAGYENLYLAAEKVWEARRRFAYKQGNLQQIPDSFNGLRGFIRAAWNYTRVTWRYVPVLWWNRFCAIAPIIPTPGPDNPGGINPDDGREKDPDDTRPPGGGHNPGYDQGPK